MLDVASCASFVTAARILGRGAADSQLHEIHGAVAAVVPAAPHQPIANLTIRTQPARDPNPLLDALGTLYQDSGVRTWQLWDATSGADMSIQAERFGYRPGGSLNVMTLDLHAFTPPTLDDFAYDSRGDMKLLGSVNAAAYPHGGGLDKALCTPLDAMHVYRASLDSTWMSVLATVPLSSDLGVYFVATLPQARSRHLASRLIAAALTDAKEQGLATASLQAQPGAVGVYERLGFRTVAQLHAFDFAPSLTPR